MNDEIGEGLVRHHEREEHWRRLRRSQHRALVRRRTRRAEQAALQARLLRTPTC